jgi:hypothetical protein
MHHFIACMFCGGMDPNADSLLLQAAIAGGITAPWVLRAKLLALIARVRGKARSSEADGDMCSLPEEDSQETSIR